MSQIEEIVIYFGSKGKLARALGITAAAVSKWKEIIPKGRAYQIEVLTEGKFKAADLCNRKVLPH